MRISDWSSDVCSSDLGFVAHGGTHAWGWGIAALLVLGGALTALPLIGFADAVRRLPYSVVGLLQYIAPTLQLLCGVLLLGADFGSERAIGFVLCWIARAGRRGSGRLGRARHHAR